MSEILVKEYRGNIVENAHRGSIAVVSSTGDTIAYLGDIEKQTFMRSASKPIQVLPTLLADFTEGSTSPTRMLPCSTLPTGEATIIYLCWRRSRARQD